MEIFYLPMTEHGHSRPLYEEVFVEDEKAFVDAYYQIKAADNQILVAEEDGVIVSMLHRNPYALRFRRTLIHADYLVAVATRLPCRHQGLMRRLLTRALQDMAIERQPFAFLMPADEAIYTPFGFRLMGNDDEEGLASLSSEQLSAEYDLYVEKDEDYRRRHIDWPEWETTPMMMRPVHLPSFASLFGAEEDQSLVVAVEDPLLPVNHGIFRWDFNQETSRFERTEQDPEFTVSIAELGSFLCGMIGPEELPGIEQSPAFEVLREKLEKIRVLRGIYINETV